MELRKNEENKPIGLVARMDTKGIIKYQSAILCTLKRGGKDEGTYFFHSFVSHTSNGIGTEQWLCALKFLIFYMETGNGPTP